MNSGFKIFVGCHALFTCASKNSPFLTIINVNVYVLYFGSLVKKNKVSILNLLYNYHQECKEIIFFIKYK